jgi:hypothetical protein
MVFPEVNKFIRRQNIKPSMAPCEVCGSTVALAGCWIKADEHLFTSGRSLMICRDCLLFALITAIE